MNLGIQLHTGATALHAIKEVTNYHVKPQGGIWTSTWINYGSAWTQFYEGVGFDLPENGLWEGILLNPRSDARIYVIDTYEDLEYLTMKYPLQTLFDIKLDFEAISEYYDAIHLTEEGEWATRLSNPYSLYGWDCESTLWFRQAFDIVKVVQFPVSSNE